MEDFKFNNGEEFGTVAHMQACEKFEAVMKHAAKKQVMPYLVGSSDIATDLAAGMVSVVASITAFSDITGGIPIGDILMFAHPDKGFVGMAVEDDYFGDGNPDEWGELAKLVQAEAIIQAAEKVKATHVYMVNLTMRHLVSFDGTQETPGVVPILRFAGWNIDAGVGLRWFARVTNTNEKTKPLQIIPWDKYDDGSRHAWRDLIQSMGVMHSINADDMGDYFMKILRPGVEALNSLDADEPIIPTHRNVETMKAGFQLGEYGEDAHELARQACDELLLDDAQYSSLLGLTEDLLNGKAHASRMNPAKVKGLEA